MEVRPLRINPRPSPVPAPAAATGLVLPLAITCLGGMVAACLVLAHGCSLVTLHLPRLWMEEPERAGQAAPGETMASSRWEPN